MEENKDSWNYSFRLKLVRDQVIKLFNCVEVHHSGVLVSEMENTNVLYMKPIKL